MDKACAPECWVRKPGKGRPPKCWDHDVRGLAGVNWKREAQDRSEGENWELYMSNRCL